MKALLKTAALAATGYVGDSPLFVVDYLLRFLTVAIMLAIWRTVFAGRGVVSGMSLGAVLTYTLISQVLADVLAVRTELGNALWDGSIATRFLQPVGLVAHFGAEAAGRWTFGLVCFGAPLLALAPLLGVDPRPAGPGALVWFFPSLAFSVAVGLALEFIFAALVVALGSSVWVVERVREALRWLLSGAFLPLALLPWNLGAVFSWLPFASMASAPLRLYTGSGDPRALLPLQAGWAVALWWLAGRLWRAQRERLVAYGG